MVRVNWWIEKSIIKNGVFAGEQVLSLASEESGADPAWGRVDDPDMKTQWGRAGPGMR